MVAKSLPLGTSNTTTPIPSYLLVNPTSLQAIPITASLLGLVFQVPQSISFVTDIPNKAIVSLNIDMALLDIPMLLVSPSTRIYQVLPLL